MKQISNLRDKKNLSTTKCTPKTSLLNNQNNNSHRII